MKILLLAVFLSPFFYPGVTPEEQAKKMCDCLKNAEKTGTPQDKSKCLELQEKLLAELGDDKEARDQFKLRSNECMTEIADAKYGFVFKSNKTFQEKVDDVCGCLKVATEKKDRNQKMYCFSLQSRYGKAFDNDTASLKKFNKHINLNCQ